MIDYKKAKEAFDNFIENYDKDNDKINLKYFHTFRVVDASIYIAEDLKLSDEDIELAKIIALLHDIGRFEQAKIYDNFADSETIDHAEYGANILFEDGMIRQFIQTDIYDSIIEKAIRNHNKYMIQDGLSEKELLHAKIIRDADKLDIFKVIATRDFKIIDPNLDKEKMEYDVVSDKIYTVFMDKKSILRKERETLLDIWVFYIAFIFDLNFNSGLKYVKENDYINRLVDRIEYKNETTSEKMENIRIFSINYIEDKINSGV